MKKSVKIWLITAAVLIVLGLLLSVIAFAAVGGDIKKLSTVKFEENTYTFDDNFVNIDISADSADVELIKTDDKECKVVCYEDETRKHTVEIAGHDEEHELVTSDNSKLGTLKGKVYDELHIEMNDTRSWNELLNLSFESPKITVYLPKAQYTDVCIETSTGCVTVPDDFSFSEISLKTDTGDLKCGASASGELKMRTSTGNIRAEDASFREAGLHTSTGNIKMDSVKVNKDIDLRVSTGNVELTDVTCNNLTVKSSTGNVKLSDVIAKGSFDIKASTGNVRFSSCDADSIEVKTNTGNINGSLRSDKIFIPKSDTGNINVPESTSGGVCKLTTNTGNIKIEIE